jgi:DNA-binding protein Alba
MMMMMTIVRENTTSSSSRPQVLLSVLLIGKKYAVEYIALALFRLNTTGELVIKATGSLSIVTAVDVAQLVKRDVGDLVTKSITIGTDELTVVGGSGISKRMSCIEIHLAKNITAPAVAIAAPETVAETVAPVIEETTTTTASNVVVTTAKKSSTRKKKSAAAAAATATKKKASRKKEGEGEIGRLGAHIPAFSYIFRLFCYYSFFITITIFFLLFGVYDGIFSRLWRDPRHSSREQHRVLDVVDVCYPAHQALDAKPKAAVRHRAVLAEVKVPVVGSRVKPFLLDALSH